MENLDQEATRKRNFFLTLGLAVLILVMVLERLNTTTADPDLWGYLAFGRLYWHSPQFPYRDIFAYLPTLPRWVYHEWLTGVIFYPIFQTLGPAGLQFLKYGFGLATLGLIYLTARRRGAGFLATAVMLMTVQGIFVMGYSPVRAQVFTYAFFALSLYLLETARLTGRWRGLVWLIPLQIFWANVHGGFLAGLGLIAIYALGEALSRRRFLPFAGIFLAAGLATLVNPYGWEYWQYLLRAVTMPRPEITEWASVYKCLRVGQDIGGNFYFLTIAAVSLTLIWLTRWRELSPLLALGLTLYLGLAHHRHQVFFLMLVGIYLPLPFTAYLEKMAADSQIRRVSRVLGWKVPVALGIFVAGLSLFRITSHPPLSLEIPSDPARTSSSAAYYPVGALQLIQKENLSGNLLTEFDWGEYLIWNLYPRCKVSLDGRFETVYGEEVCQAYFDFINGGTNWRAFLQQYPPAMVLVKSRGQIDSLMASEPGWREAYRDPACALFLPRDRTAAAGPKNFSEGK